MLRRRTKIGEPGEIDIEEQRLLREASPAKEWVNLFLLHLCKDSGGSSTLRKSKGIPAIPHDEEVPPGGFDFDRIINRLKVMSGLDPVICKEPRKGRISLDICGIRYHLDTIFVDSGADSQCEIVAQREVPQ